MKVESTLIDALHNQLGHGAVLCGDAARGRRYRDWSEAAAVAPEVVVRPTAPSHVATVLKLCSQYRQPIAVQGGLTGLVGGANPQAAELVLTLEGLDKVEDIDTIGGTAVAQAGVTMQHLQETAAAQGWLFPVDIGSRGSAQLGGNVATNAGGNRVLRFGMMRENVLGIEVALADGTLLTMLDRVVKNNAGFDLKQLFIGSEGTLGIVTRVSLKLVPLGSASRTVLCALPDFDSATELLSRARRWMPCLSSFELMWASYFDASLKVLGRPQQFATSYPLYVLIETVGADELAASLGLDTTLEQALGDKIIVDAVIAQSLTQADSLWAIREGVVDLLKTLSPHVAFDVSVPLAIMRKFVEDIDRILRQSFPEQSHLLFGHLGDGNLHLLSGRFANPKDMRRIEEVVYAAVAGVSGSISAEHGIGIVKRPFLHHTRPDSQAELMRQIKTLLDPGGILNRGRVVDWQATSAPMKR